MESYQYIKQDKVTKYSKASGLRVIDFGKVLGSKEPKMFIKEWHNFNMGVYGYMPEKFDDKVYKEFMVFLSRIIDEVWDKDGEYWVDVPDYKGRYWVSNLGRMKFKKLVDGFYRRITLLRPKYEDGRVLFAMTGIDGETIRMVPAMDVVWESINGSYDKLRWRVVQKGDDFKDVGIKNLKLERRR